MSGVNKEPEKKIDEFNLYLGGLSISECSEATSIPKSTLRFRFKRAGILRSRAEGVRQAAAKGKLSSLKGRNRIFTDEWRENISKGRLLKSRLTSKCTSKKPSGYMEFTTGQYKGKSVHSVVMELKIGRPLIDDEVVHHIDGDKENNSIDNLALMTRSAHAALHRREDKLERKHRERNKNGQWN